MQQHESVAAASNGMPSKLEREGSTRIEGNSKRSCQEGTRTEVSIGDDEVWFPLREASQRSSTAFGNAIVDWIPSRHGAIGCRSDAD